MLKVPFLYTFPGNGMCMLCVCIHKEFKSITPSNNAEELYTYVAQRAWDGRHSGNHNVARVSYFRSCWSRISARMAHDLCCLYAMVCIRAAALNDYLTQVLPVSWSQKAQKEKIKEMDREIRRENTKKLEVRYPELGLYPQ